LPLLVDVIKTKELKMIDSKARMQTKYQEYKERFDSLEMLFGQNWIIRNNLSEIEIDKLQDNIDLYNNNIEKIIDELDLYKMRKDKLNHVFIIST